MSALLSVGCRTKLRLFPAAVSCRRLQLKKEPTLSQDQSVSMSSLDSHQQLSAGCRDKSTAADSEECTRPPLQGLQLASHAVLDRARQRGRVSCSRCGRNRMFFCYNCCLLLGTDKEAVPRVQVVLVFPGPQAVSFEDMLQRLRDRSSNGSGDSGEPRPKRLRAEGVQATPLKKVVFIDSTWNQTNEISTDERLQGLLRVELTSRKTCFWRSQHGKPDTYLATIEAIYYFLKDFHQLGLGLEYHGEYDNLLFFYSYLHSLVNSARRAASRS
ncbi:tRNA-uridine aminocarboxypropyltransferase 1 isoform X3 [Austrofundulus limnaeus]|uniref:tRNA-uridine aminocarboxypropyltransferase 1 n=1 Tax=Austrofundulus limnaeus TaxID=52670 RepID=A0A2I4CXC2_AUSLI|nr:PREDICTED: DTW domain-containing protein 1 isoform X3 [Austrofundulus limnaeus]